MSDLDATLAAFLAQPDDVMDTVQGLRKRAKDEGNLETTEQQKAAARRSAERALEPIVGIAAQHPTGFANWLTALELASSAAPPFGDEEPPLPYEEQRDLLRRVYRNERFAMDYLNFVIRKREEYQLRINDNVAVKVASRAPEHFDACNRDGLGELELEPDGMTLAGHVPRFLHQHDRRVERRRR